MTCFQTTLNQRIIACILIICMFSLTAGSFLFYPRQTQASKADWLILAWLRFVEALEYIWRTAMLKLQALQTAIDVWAQSKTMVKWGMGKALNTLLHRLLAQITKNITDWIQNGGEPRFLSMGLDDWISGELNKAGGAFVEQYLGAGWLCEPFDLELKLAFKDIPPFTDEVSCTLSDVVDNIDDFYDDFSQGGWAGFVSLTEPQNNLYGAALMAQYEFESVEARAQKDLETDMANNDGFQSMKECIWYQNETELKKGKSSKGKPLGKTVGPKLKDQMGIPSMPSACYSAPPNYDNPGITAGGFQGPCVSECTVLTPGSTIKTIADKTMNWFDQINAQIAAATEKAGPLGVYVQAILNALINRVMTEGVGLLKAGTDNDPGGALTEPEYGDLGEADKLPKIVDPEDVMQEQTDANLLIGQLEILDKKLKDIETHTATRIANLKSVLPFPTCTTETAEDDCAEGEVCDTAAWACVEDGKTPTTTDTYAAILGDLEDLKKCKDDEIAKWAKDEWDAVDAMKAARLGELLALEGWELAKVDIPATIATTTIFINEVDVYLEIWEKYGGVMPTINGQTDPNSEFAQAQKRLNDAKADALWAVELILVNFVDLTKYSYDFKGHTKAAQDTTMIVHKQGEAMKIFTGAELITEAQGIQREVNDYRDRCSSLRRLDDIDRRLYDIEINTRP